MSAGTIVTAGGVLAGVILLCIVAVLCYCRLQYYCCRRSGSEVEAGPPAAADPLSHFPCNACNALAMDGTAIGPVSLDQLDMGPAHNPTCPTCPTCSTCSPYSRRAGAADMRNGGERLGFHTYYENLPAPLPLSHPQASAPLGYYGPSDMFPPPPPPHSYSTDV